MNIQERLQNNSFIIVCGHYGCGKTNLAINMAIDLAKCGEKVTLVDLDLVNPYFRSSDYPELLRQYDVDLLSSTYAHSNVDLPAIPTELYSMLTREGRVIVDVGGDDAGATALGRFSAQIKQHDYTMLYVVNRFRALSTTPEEAVGLMAEIEEASRLRTHYIVNNSHIMEYTDRDKLLEGYSFARSVSEKTGLPLLCSAVERRLIDESVSREIDDIYPIDIYVKKVWD